MSIADWTLTVFTLCNSLRAFAYVPQIVAAAKCRDGAKAISFTTWTLFTVSHSTTAVYALVNLHDVTMALMFLLNAAGCLAIIAVAVWQRMAARRRRAETAAVPVNVIAFALKRAS